MGAFWFVVAALLGYALALLVLRLESKAKVCNNGEGGSHEGSAVDYDAVINIV